MQLAAYGLDQANQLSTFLSSPSRLDPYPVPERVFSSPFYRCIQTAVPTSIALKSGGKVVDAGTLGRAETAKTDEEVGLGPGGVDTARKGEGVLLEHGVMEWSFDTMLYLCLSGIAVFHPRAGTEINDRNLSVSIRTSG